MTEPHAPSIDCAGCRELFAPSYRCCRFCDRLDVLEHRMLARWHGAWARWYRWRAGA